MKNKTPHARISAGFTIVELLIVIIVIGILAALVLVAYSNVTDQAKASVDKNDLEQIAKQLNLYKENSGGGTSYPADASSLQYSSGTTIQYSVNNSVSPATYCVTATNGNKSYYLSSTSQVPAVGGCPGHGVNGNVASTNVVTNPSGATSTGSTVVIATNLATTPSFEGGAANYGGIGSTTKTYAVDSSTAYTGSSSLKITSTADGSIGAKFMIDSAATFPVGSIISWSVMVRPTAALTIQPYWESGSPSYSGGNGGSGVSAPANTWTMISGTMTVTNASASGYGFGFFSTSGTNGTSVYMDAGLVRQVDQPSLGTYFDGSTALTADYTYGWSGTANASSSYRRAYTAVGWNVNQQTAGAIAYQMTMPSGNKGVRMLFPAGIASSSWRVLQVDIASQSLLQAGSQSTFIPRWRKSSTLSNTSYNLWIEQGNGTGGYYGPTLSISTTMNEVSGTVTNSATPVAGTVLYMGMNSDASNYERWIDFEHVAVMNTNYTGGYQDGSSPSWIWNGSANASTSTGP